MIINPYRYASAATPTDFLLRPLNLDNDFIPMDGTNLVSFGGELHLIFGWNGTVNAPPASKKTHWKSSDGGYTWTQLTDFPGTERHSAGCVVFGGKIWIFGGDFLTDVWTYDAINGWVQVTANWGIGDRGLFTYWTDGTYIYLAGGQDTIPSSNFYTTVYRTSDGITWSSIGNLPSGDVSTGVALVKGSDFYVFSGGQYIGAGVINWNTNIYKSVDGGVNWTTLASTLPSAMRSGYPSGAVWDNKIWYLMGSNTSANNEAGLYYTEDLFASWTALYDNPKARHAEQMTVQNNKLYVVAGNLWNDSYAIEKVPQTSSIPAGAEMAISFFKLIPSYSGSCIRIERSSDNTQQDIGFDVNGYLDVATILSFVGIGNGKVVTFYDQSGNGYDWTAAFADAPIICTSGAMNLENGIAAMACNGTMQMSLASPLSMGTTHSFHVVCNMTAYSSILGAPGNNYVIYPTGADYCYYNASGSYTFNYSATLAMPINQQILVELYRKDKTVQMFVDGNKMGDASACSVEFMGANNMLTVENLLGDSGDKLVGNLQALVAYSSDVLTQRKGLADTLINLFSI
jgi:N-acetylneuraminic acid mutarotase